MTPVKLVKNLFRIIVFSGLLIQFGCEKSEFQPAVKDRRDNSLKQPYLKTANAVVKSVKPCNHDTCDQDSTGKRRFTGKDDEPATLNQTLTLKPNPATNQVTMQFRASTSQTVRLTVFDMQGSPVAKETFRAGKGANEYQYNLEKLAKGKYVFKLRVDERWLQGRLVVK